MRIVSRHLTYNRALESRYRYMVQSRKWERPPGYYVERAWYGYKVIVTL